MIKQVVKICNVCGQNVEKLTHEHIPPKSLGNKGRMSTISSEFLFDVVQGKNDYRNSINKKYEIRYLKDGQTFKTVCEKCNNWSGIYLVNDFNKVFFLIIQEYLKRGHKQGEYLTVDLSVLGADFDKIYKNFIKHIIFQFMCIQYAPVKGLNDILKQEKNTEDYYLFFQLADPIMDVCRLTHQLGRNPKYDMQADKFEKMLANPKNHKIPTDFFVSKTTSKICYYSLHITLERFDEVKPILDNKLFVFDYKMKEPVIYIKTKIIETEKNRKYFLDALF